MKKRLEVPLLFGLGNVLRAVLLGDRIAATISVFNATKESRTIRKTVHWLELPIPRRGWQRKLWSFALPGCREMHDDEGG